MNIEGSDPSLSKKWCCFGTEVPKNEIVYFCQIIVIFTIIVTSLYQLAVGSRNNELWISLLSSSLGYILPNPTIKGK